VAQQSTNEQQVTSLQLCNSTNQLITSAQRTNLSEQPLIELEMSFASQDIELDPLKNTNYPSSDQSFDRDIMFANALPIAKPRPSKGSVIRSNQAVQNREPTFGLDFGQTRNIQSTPQDAPSGVRSVRSEFIHTDVSKPTVLRENRLGSLDQFDPLASGQLIVDAYNPASSSSGSSRSNAQDEENLLKEWNLDFKYRGNVPTHGSPSIQQAQMYPTPHNAAFGYVANRGPMFRPQYPIGSQGYSMAPPANFLPFMPGQQPRSNVMQGQSQTRPVQLQSRPQGYVNLYPNIASTAPNMRQTMDPRSSPVTTNVKLGAAVFPQNTSCSLPQQSGSGFNITAVRNGNNVPPQIDVNNMAQPSQWEQFE